MSFFSLQLCFLFFFFLLPYSVLAQISKTHFLDKTGKNPITGGELILSSPFGSLPSSGHYYVIAEVRNPSDKILNWKIQAQSRVYSYGDGKNEETNSSFNLQCPAKETKRFELKIPINNSGSYHHFSHSRILNTSYNNATENNLQFEIFHGGETYYASVDGKHSKSAPLTLISSDASKINTEALSLELTEFVTGFDPTLLNADFMNLKNYEVLVLSKNEWQQLNKDVRQALLKWVRLGGYLIIAYDKKTKPEQAVELLDMASKEEKKQLIYQMNNVIMARDFPFFKQQYGQGSIYLNPNITKGAEAEETFLLQLKKLDKSLYPYHNSGKILNWELLSQFKQKKEGVGILILLLFLFAIAIGPLNFYVFAKQGKRHRLFFTTSIISLASCLLLGGIILIKDGVGGKGIRLVHKEIDSKSKASFIIQEQISKTGLLLNTDFEIKEKCELIQVENTNKGNKFQLQQTAEGTNFSGDYFASKQVQGQVITANQITPEGFSIQKKGTQLVVQSSFKHIIEEFYYTDANSTVWCAKNLKTGAEVVLEKSTNQSYFNAFNALTGDCSPYMRDRIEHLIKRPSSYLAKSHSAPGIETLSSISWKTKTLLTGEIELL